MHRYKAHADKHAKVRGSDEVEEGVEDDKRGEGSLQSGRGHSLRERRGREECPENLDLYIQLDRESVPEEDLLQEVFGGHGRSAGA